MTSWVQYDETCHFPIQNIPFGVILIGSFAVDLTVLASEGLFQGPLMKEKARTVFAPGLHLNAFMSLGKQHWRETRQTLQALFSANNGTLENNKELQARAMIPLASVQNTVPAKIGDYTDFYSSKEHATNVGIMFRGKDNALMPNWVHLPVGYHGRSSSIVVSGTDVHRPKGQTKADTDDAPKFSPCKLMDFELEMAFFVGQGNDLGESVDVNEANDKIFGIVLMNDWSARDIQKWEYVPLGPFNAKNFATTISPWIITLDALEPFKCPAPEQDPAVLPYLQEKSRETFDINLTVGIQGPQMAEAHTVCQSNFKYLYWTMAQQLAHHSVTGCNMQAGDLCGSGTISGQEPSSFGSMLELSWRGSKPLPMPDGTERKFLQDNDTVIMDGYAQGNGFRIGFGGCVGKVLPAKP